MLESWEEQNASCDECAQRDPPLPPQKKQKTKKTKKNILSMESGMNRKLEENFRMTGEITKVRCNKLGLKSL